MFKRLWGTRIGRIIGVLAVIALLCEICAAWSYFGMMSVFGLLGPVFKYRDVFIAWLTCVASAVLLAVGFVGVMFCFTGTVGRQAPFQWLLLLLSVLGLLPLPISVYYGVNDEFGVMFVRILAAWGVLLLVTTLVAFSYLKSKPPKPQVWGE